MLKLTYRVCSHGLQGVLFHDGVEVCDVEVMPENVPPDQVHQCNWSYGEDAFTSLIQLVDWMKENAFARTLRLHGRDENNVEVRSRQWAEHFADRIQRDIYRTRAGQN